MPFRFAPICRAAVALSSLWAPSVASALPATHPARTFAAPDPAVQQLKALLATYVKEVGAEGFTCSIAAPALQIKDVASWGNYNSATNTITSPLWSQVPPEGKAVFHRIAGPNSTDEAAHKEFERGAHHWIFVHELGHWWQACQHANAAHTHYQVEYGANRLAAAYWREHDPAMLRAMDGIFHGLIDHAPNPVPAGQTAEGYFNDNYEKLAPTPVYTWYQSQMVVKAYDETPAPSFHQALAEVRNP